MAGEARSLAEQDDGAAPASGTGTDGGDPQAADRAGDRAGHRWWLAQTGWVLVVAGAALTVRSATLPLLPLADGLSDGLGRGLTAAAIAGGSTVLAWIVAWDRMRVLARRGLPVAPARVRGRRACRWLAVIAGLVVSGAALVPSVFALRDQIDGGVPRMGAPLLTAGLLVGVAGLVALALAPPRLAPGGPPARRRLAVGGVSLLVALVAVVASVVVARAVERGAVDATTAAADAGAASMVDPPSRVSWTRDVRPYHTAVVELSSPVVAAGSGVAYDDGDGIVALDGRDGSERWHHRRPGAHLTRLRGSPGGEWVLAAFSPPGGFGKLRVALNGRTGEVGVEVSDGQGAYWADDLTDHALVDTRHGMPRAFDPGTGHELWTWQPPDDCPEPNIVPTAATGSDTVFVGLVCVANGESGLVSSPSEGRVRLVGLDDRTGIERWRYEARYDSEQTPEPRLRPSPLGQAVELEWGSVRSGTARRTSVLLDAATGDVLAEDHDLYGLGWPSDSGWLAGRAPDGGFELHGPVGASGTHLSTGCGAPDRQEMVAVADSLVQRCGGLDPDAVAVVSRTEPDRPRTIPVSLPPDDPGDAYLVASPGVIVVVSRAGRLIALA